MKPFHLTVLAWGALSLLGCSREQVPLPRVAAPTVEATKAGEPAVTDAAAALERETFTAQAERRIESFKARLAELRSGARNVTADLKAKLEARNQAMADELAALEERLAEMKAASAEKWRELRASVSAAIDRLEESFNQTKKEGT